MTPLLYAITGALFTFILCSSLVECQSTMNAQRNVCHMQGGWYLALDSACIKKDAVINLHGDRP